MEYNIVESLMNLSGNLTDLKQEVAELPELKSSRAIVNPFGKNISPEVKEKRKYLGLGLKALGKIENGTEDQINEDEQRGLEAIISQVVRPAILIKKGHFSPPTAQWKILNNHRKQIENSSQCVGRIEVSGHPEQDWVGTGFIAGKNVIMTNRHVALHFAEADNNRWKFLPNRSASIDFIREFKSSQSLGFEIEGIIGIHSKFDLALLSVKEKSDTGAALLSPLEVTTNEPDINNKVQVYVVGYPAYDGTRNEPEVMRRIFADIYDVKRLQPGLVTAFDRSRQELLHDCSTLGGNSGSPVFDLKTSQIIGLHFGGRYLQSNYAVALWTLTNDPLLKKHVNFV